MGKEALCHRAERSRGPAVQCPVEIRAETTAVQRKSILHKATPQHRLASSRKFGSIQASIEEEESARGDLVPRLSKT